MVICALSGPGGRRRGVLGSQGNTWDAQKDILANTLGVILVTLIFFFQNKNQLVQLRSHTSD